MTEALIQTTVVEAELAQLQQDLKHHLLLVGELTTIQEQFHELAATYEKIKQFLPQATSTLSFLQTQVSDGFAEMVQQKQAVQAELKLLKTENETILKAQQASFAQAQLHLEQLRTQIQQSSVQMLRQSEELGQTMRKSQLQLETNQQVMQNYQQSLQTVERNAAHELAALRNELNIKARRLTGLYIVLLLMVMGLSAYLLVPLLSPLFRHFFA